MPYFLYKIFPRKKLELQEQFDAFKDARDRARAMRAEMTAEDDYTVKVMFAENVEEAERQLKEHREPPILMEHEK